MNEYTFFYKGPLSQWYKSNFIDESSNIEYSCAEQYMMYNKAILFKDDYIADLILKEVIPKNQQSLGRKVRNFDINIWNENARRIVFNGNVLKFKQNEKLGILLKNTTGLLVEASPIDRIWGVGLSESDERIYDKSNWVGTNWLGEVLTNVRGFLYEGLKLTDIEFY